MSVGPVNLPTLLATIDLQLVRLLRSAMRVADCAAAGPGGIAPRPVHHPDPRIDPRPVVRPDPRFQPRPVIHPRPQFEPRPVVQPDPGMAPAEPNHRCDSEPVLPPPWKQVPWSQSPQPRPIIKPIVRPADLPHKGTVLDLFT